MKYIDWNEKKNLILRLDRDVCFEDVLIAIEEGRVLDIVRHQNIEKYPNQKIMIIKIRSYAYLVPYVEDEEKIFLKTIIPSRKATRIYILKNNKNEIL